MHWGDHFGWQPRLCGCEIASGSDIPSIVPGQIGRVVLEVGQRRLVRLPNIDSQFQLNPQAVLDLLLGL
jgi:hypothetical protein